jgi:hypothetical protein
MKVVAFAVDAGFRENCGVFSQPLFTDSAFYPVAFFICFTVVFLTFFTAVTVIIYVKITRVQIVNHFLGIIVYTFGFYFLLTNDLRSSENFSMETFRCT